MNKITLLSPHSFTNSVFASLPPSWRNRIDVLDLVRLRAPTPGRIGFAQVADFKGLESPFVILESAKSAEASALRALLYVGMTRARAALWLIDSIAEHDESAE